MVPHLSPAAVANAAPETVLRRLLGRMSIFTLVMTVPQVPPIWVGHLAAGVSLWSWSAYLLSALLCLWFGVQKSLWSKILATTR
jgi:hypothetical protein